MAKFWNKLTSDVDMASVYGTARSGIKSLAEGTMSVGKDTFNKLNAVNDSFMRGVRPGMEKASLRLLDKWEPRFGARKTLGGSLAMGTIVGMGMSSFKFNREITPEAMANAQEGSAYGAGPGAFGVGDPGASRMPDVSGRRVMGMHNKRHG